jgi:hypothetical protein
VVLHQHPGISAKKALLDRAAKKAHDDNYDDPHVRFFASTAVGYVVAFVAKTLTLVSAPHLTYYQSV